MAKDTRKNEEPKPVELAYGLVRRGGLWVARTYRMKGETVVGFEDSAPDTKVVALTHALRDMERQP